MAVYLGNKLGGFTNIKYVEAGSIPSDDPSQSINHTISDEKYTQLVETIQYRTNKSISNTSIDNLIAQLNQNYMVTMEQENLKYSFTDTWTRPNDWPDLDSLNLQFSGENDFIYMTYDTTIGRCAIALHIEAVSGGTPISVTIGHINNGTYIVDETITGSSNNYVKWFENPSGYPVVRILGSIKLCYTYEVTNNISGSPINGIKQQLRQQPIVERLAYVPHLIHLGNGYSSQAWGTFSLQREKIVNGNGSALTQTYYAWAYCRDLQQLDISQFYTPNVTSLSYTFYQCLKLKTLNLTHWDVSHVLNFSGIFSQCRALTEINLTDWQIGTNIASGKKVNFANMFDTCFSLTTILGLSSFDVSKVESLSSTFKDCRALKELDLSNWHISNYLTTLANTFGSCYSLIKLDLSNFDVSNVTLANSTFNNCRSLKQLDMTGWNLTKLTTIGSVFTNCYALSNIDISGWHISNICTNIYNAFGGCTSLIRLDFPSWDVSGLSSSNSTANSLFSGCWSLETITGISNWNFQLNNSLGSMFANCYSLKSVDISGWNVNTATNLSSMFANCFCLTELNLTNWNTTNCTTLASMFSECHSLKTVGNISNWNTAKVTTMASMFSGCLSLQAFPNIANWDFRLVTTLANMFNSCISLKEIILKNISLPKCTTMATMFRYCYNLEKVDLSGWTLTAMNTAPGAFLGDCWSLHDVEGITIPPLNITFANDENLSYLSIQTILEALPVTATARTINLTAMNNNKLLAAQRTEIKNTKNWTVAA